MPMPRYGNGVGPAFIIKARGLIHWTTETVKGPRRCRRFSPWERITSAGRATVAAGALERAKAEHGARFTEFAVFYDGKRLAPEQLAFRVQQKTARA